MWLKSGLLPDYYTTSFHYQTDGWLSSKSGGGAWLGPGWLSGAPGLGTWLVPGRVWLGGQ